jgi:hypothetical protein
VSRSTHCFALSLIASGNETTSHIDDYVPGNCRIRESGIVLVYDRSGAAESVIQAVDVDLFCVKQTVVSPEILYAKLHDLPAVVCGLPQLAPSSTGSRRRGRHWVVICRLSFAPPAQALTIFDHIVGLEVQAGDIVLVKLVVG